MNVGYYMTKNPVVVSPETTVPEAQALMRREKIHRLPVLDKAGKLIGIVSASDLAHASAAPTTSLDMYELHYLISKMTVETVMTKEVVTITEDLPIEEAARIMADSDISGLPVMRNGVVIGIITESDIFRLFISLFGARHAGVRLTVLMPEKRGELAEVSGAIARAGGNIVSLTTFDGEDPTNHYCTMKVAGLERQVLIDVVTPLVERIVDVRQRS
ncbi:MAG: CBS and ACT domain-containing protein [Clostridia bacterium]|jgi:acetoin utilization protein AcuB|nr:CBS and ACT domain-containing protein [Spirochaetia bacterium]